MLQVFQKVLLDDGFMMPFFEILVILLLLVLHHDFRAVYQLVHIDVNLFPGISHGRQPQADIVQLRMGGVYLLCEIFIGNIFREHQVLVPCQPIYLAAVEVLPEHFADADDHLVPVLSSEFLVEILQPVDIHRKGAQGFQLPAFHMLQVIHQAVPVEQTGQIIVVA